jgi:branched-chain amino acid transport system substrate-binding protein
MRPAGPEKAVGIITAAYIKEPSDPQWQETPEYKEWLAWMNKYNTAANATDAFAVYGYSVRRPGCSCSGRTVTISHVRT